MKRITVFILFSLSAFSQASIFLAGEILVEESDYPSFVILDSFHDPENEYKQSLRITGFSLTSQQDQDQEICRLSQYINWPTIPVETVENNGLVYGLSGNVVNNGFVYRLLLVRTGVGDYLGFKDSYELELSRISDSGSYSLKFSTGGRKFDIKTLGCELLTF